MSEVRRDIAEAAARMAVTFGTRSAMRDLAEELGAGEHVVELAACTYAGAAGLVALTSHRVIAIRDDYSKHQVQFVVVAEVVTVDYDPTVHDGFALFTTSGRLVVRKMRRQDGDRLVDALLTRAPHIAVQVSRPAGAPVVAAEPQLGGQLGRLGRHRKPAIPASAAHPAPPANPVSPGPPPPSAASVASAQAGAAIGAAQAAGGGDLGAPAAAVAAGPTGTGLGSSGAGLAATPAPGPTWSAVAPLGSPSDAASGPRPATDKEILLGVLADLHAQGVLTAEEFAAKVRQIVTQG